MKRNGWREEKRTWGGLSLTMKEKAKGPHEVERGRFQTLGTVRKELIIRRKE